MKSKGYPMMSEADRALLERVGIDLAAKAPRESRGVAKHRAIQSRAKASRAIPTPAEIMFAGLRKAVRK